MYSNGVDYPIALPQSTPGRSSVFRIRAQHCIKRRKPAWSKAKVRDVAETISIIVGREVARMAPRPPRRIILV